MTLTLLHLPSASSSGIPKSIGTWTALKLEYLDHYLQAYRRVTKKARGAHYLDLFAGPGVCVIRKTGWPVDGSPWRAMNAIPPFSSYLFVEKSPKLAKHLRDRISLAAPDNAQVFEGDCNGPVLGEVLSQVPRKEPSFAFLDPSGLQLHWSTVEKLARHRLGSWKMELLILYPYDMVIKRWLSQSEMRNALTSAHGSDQWSVELAESQRSGEDGNERRDRFVNLYKRNLQRLGYRHVVSYGPLGYGLRPYYNVLFASDHGVGAKIMNAVWSKPRLIPGQLGYAPLKRPAR